MTTTVIDWFEAIKVNEQHTAIVTARLNVDQRLFQLIFKFASVEQAGQGVVGGELLQAFFQCAALAEVDHYAFDEFLMRTQVQRQVDPAWPLFEVVQLALAADCASLHVELQQQPAPLGFAHQTLQ